MFDVLLVLVSDMAPEAEDVKAGPIAFWLFIGGIVAVALLGWSLVRQLRKVEAARKAGVYGDEPETEPTTEEQSPQA